VNAEERQERGRPSRPDLSLPPLSLNIGQRKSPARYARGRYTWAQRTGEPWGGNPRPKTQSREIVLSSALRHQERRYQSPTAPRRPLPACSKRLLICSSNAVASIRSTRREKAPALALAGEGMPARRFPPSWTVEDHNGACFIMKDHNGHSLAFVYHDEEVGRQAAANLMTRDEARRIAANIAKLPEL
jgi:hypothetical protein